MHNTPIAELLTQYEAECCPLDDLEWVSKSALRLTETMPDSQVRCLLYLLATHVREELKVNPAQKEVQCGVGGFGAALDILDCLQDRPIASSQALPDKSVKSPAVVDSSTINLAERLGRAEEAWGVLASFDGSFAIDQWDETFPPTRQWDKLRREVLSQPMDNTAMKKVLQSDRDRIVSHIRNNYQDHTIDSLCDSIYPIPTKKTQLF